MRVVQASSRTAGAATHASQPIGTATMQAKASGRVSASRLGTSSPRIRVRKVISATAITLPITTA